MGFEFPRPTYPGDFVSCNMYRSPLGFFFYILYPPPDLFETIPLVLPHDGVVSSQLYEIVFGPFSYSVTEGAEMALEIYTVIPDVGDLSLYTQTFLFQNAFTFVPAISAYFAPDAIVDFLNEDLAPNFSITDFGPLQARFTMAGAPGAAATVEWGQKLSGTVFGLRPVDETNSDTFRVITTIDDSYAS